MRLMEQIASAAHIDLVALRAVERSVPRGIWGWHDILTVAGV